MRKGVHKPDNVWRLVLDFPGRRYQIARCSLSAEELPVRLLYIVSNRVLEDVPTPRTGNLFIHICLVLGAFLPPSSPWFGSSISVCRGASRPRATQIVRAKTIASS